MYTLFTYTYVGIYFYQHENESMERKIVVKERPPNK